MPKLHHGTANSESASLTLIAVATLVPAVFKDASSNLAAKATAATLHLELSMILLLDAVFLPSLVSKRISLTQELLMFHHISFHQGCLLRVYVIRYYTKQ